MKETDALQHFLFEQANIRGQIINLKNTYQTIVNQHPYPEGVKEIIAQALMSCLFLASNMKCEGKLSLQFQGDKRLSLVVIQCDQHLQLRALAKYQEDLTTKEYANAFIRGKMLLTMSQENQTQVYQSIVPIHSPIMSENLTHYFLQSDQIPSYIKLAVSQDMAAGLLLQYLPGKDLIDQENLWDEAVVLGKTMTDEELLTLDNQLLLHRLYHESEIRLFDSRPIQFKCTCSKEKMKQALTVLDEKETKQLLQETGKVEINCDFCNTTYCFDAQDINENTSSEGPGVEIIAEIGSDNDLFLGKTGKVKH